MPLRPLFLALIVASFAVVADPPAVQGSLLDGITVIRVGSGDLDDDDRACGLGSAGRLQDQARTRLRQAGLRLNPDATVIFWLEFLTLRLPSVGACVSVVGVEVTEYHEVRFSYADGPQRAEAMIWRGRKLVASEVARHGSSVGDTIAELTGDFIDAWRGTQSVAVGGTKPSASTAEAPAPSPSSGPMPVIFETWNSAGCGFTDTSRFTLGGPTSLSALVVWYKWNAGEQSVPYQLLEGGQVIYDGAFARGNCDTYQQSWCEAKSVLRGTLDPGTYDIRTSGGRVCQNQSSGGNGFVRVHGLPAGPQSQVQGDTTGVPAGYRVTRNAAISGYNNRHLTDVSPQDCANQCNAESSFTCKSFDYYKSSRQCDLSAASAEDAGGLKTDYGGNPYDHYARVGVASSTEGATGSGQGGGAVLGSWDTGWGRLELRQSGNGIAGTYEEDNGEVLGALEAGRGNVLVGYWIEDQSARSCDEPKNGRYNWGHFRLVFTGNSFDGEWGYCDGGIAGNWSGQRTN